MQIDTSFFASTNAKAISSNPIRPTTAKAADPAEFAATQALDLALHSAPDIRPEKVERAARLLEDPNYPPQELIRRLSRLIAVNIESNAGPE